MTVTLRRIGRPRCHRRGHSDERCSVRPQPAARAPRDLAEHLPPGPEPQQRDGDDGRRANFMGLSPWPRPPGAAAGHRPGDACGVVRHLVCLFPVILAPCINVANGFPRLLPPRQSVENEGSSRGVAPNIVRLALRMGDVASQRPGRSIGAIGIGGNSRRRPE